MRSINSGNGNKASTAVPPQLWRPTSGILMTNNITQTNFQKAVPCLALSKNDSYVLSASGGQISLYNINTFKTMTTFMPPPPAATYLAFHPQDNNVIAIGMEDFSVQIYDVCQDEVKARLKGHRTRVTGLAFSSVLDVLVSSSADYACHVFEYLVSPLFQLRVWTLEGWDKRASKILLLPPKSVQHPHWQTRVQFHQDQKHVLAVQETQIAIYEASRLEFIDQGTKSENNRCCILIQQPVDLHMLSRWKRVYLHCSRTENKVQDQPHSLYILSTKQLGTYLLVITSHPSEANQFALGMSDDEVYVLEPLESKGKWGSESQQDVVQVQVKAVLEINLRDSRTQRMLRNSPCIGAGKETWC